MYKNSLLANSVRFALISGAAAAALSAPAVMAADEDKVERIEVTGSRIKRTDLETASPMTTITAEQMAVQGIQDVGQFLQNSAVMSGSPAMTTTNNGGNGGTFVELRGLGSSRTLVLVNGRRPVSSDFQSIPSSMIERIEVLKDGASATYGADAVAGVVNIITRRDFEGIEATYQTSNSFDVDTNKQNSFSIVAGKAFEDGHFVVGADYVKQDAVYQGDSDVNFLNNPWVIFGSEAEESFWKNGLIGEGENANTYFLGSGSTPCGQYYLASGPSQTNGTCDGGIATLDDMRDFTDADTYNYNPVNYLQTPYEKLNFFAEGHFEFNDHVSVYSETRINHRQSRQELAAVPYDTRYDPAYSGVTPDGTEFNGVSADNYYNPFGEDVLRSRRRMLEGGRSFEQDVTRFQQVIGFEGDINDNYYYDVNYNYGHSQTASTDFGQLYGPNLAKAMGPSFQDADGNIVCGTPDAPISDCVSMNVFGGPGSITQEMLDYVTAPLIDSSVYTLQTFTAFVGGDVVELPAGYISGGIGYEYRKEELEAVNDSGKFMGEVTGNKGKGTSGSLEVNSLFGEFVVPVLADLPGVERLDLKAGIRFDDFDAFDSATTYQLGLEWDIVDGLLFRSTYGTVFRAPGIYSLYSPESDSFPSAIDPCSSGNWANLDDFAKSNCMADGVPNGGSNNNDAQQLAQVGGNADLQPEEGDTFTVGFAYSPEFVDGLGLTVDYWAIEIDDVIDSISAGDSLDGCYLGGVSDLCANIERTNGEITYLNEKSVNLSRMTAKGIDFEADYALEAWGGDLAFNLSWTHFLERENQVYNTSTFTFEMRDLNGRFENDTTYATDKLNFTASYAWEDFSINYNANYISGVEYEDLTYWGTTPNDPDDLTKGNHQYGVDSFIYHDITASYNFEWGTKLSVGVTNLTDELPPYIESAFNGSTDESTYRLFGRSWFMRISQKF
ncbi:TonB-dependent receptor [Shewanella insulae]|uniref:TonB-dependent receptor domain-containing protein n=1 Tax=Shewanella insulae TaxID=2681496 RepID=UPI001EFD15F2|nr:TonB-dependent receptor [Shewanella insulae]MCG9714344.1 TonB-dependent receptor [Shewanella insulae]MCG9756623.1 TonB-dependent receptor [Shewanella insulae]